MDYALGKLLYELRSLPFVKELIRHGSHFKTDANTGCLHTNQQAEILNQIAD